MAYTHMRERVGLGTWMDFTPQKQHLSMVIYYLQQTLLISWEKEKVIQKRIVTAMDAKRPNINYFTGMDTLLIKRQSFP